MPINAIKLSISVKLTLLISVIVSISIAMVAMFTYIRSENQLLDSITIELRSIVQSTAPLINANAHDNILYDADEGLEGKEEFHNIQSQLIKVRDSNNMPHGKGLSPIYTLRKSWDFENNQQLEFIIMTDTNKQGQFYVGALYPIRDFQRRALEGQVTVTKIYHDTEGAWMTAAAPIINDQQNVVAILQADRRVDYIEQQINDLQLLYIISGISSLLLGIVLALIFAWRTTKPIKQLTHAVMEFGFGNMDFRIKQQRGDEFGFLFRNFNNMAEKIAVNKRKLVKANLESEHARTAAESASKAKSEFLAVVSHEIRTPMNGILGMVQVLEESKLDQVQRNYVNIIHRSGDALLVILNDILDFSKIDAGKLELDPVDFDLENSCLDIIELLTAKAQENNITLYIRVAPDSPRWVFGDDNDARQTLVNRILS